MEPELLKWMQSRPKTTAPAKESAHFPFPYSSIFHSFHTPVFLISPCLMWKMLTCVWMLTIKNSFKLGKEEPISFLFALSALRSFHTDFLSSFHLLPTRSFFTSKTPLRDLEHYTILPLSLSVLLPRLLSPYQASRRASSAWPHHRDTTRDCRLHPVPYTLVEKFDLEAISTAQIKRRESQNVIMWPFPDLPNELLGAYITGYDIYINYVMFFSLPWKNEALL